MATGTHGILRRIFRAWAHLLMAKRKLLQPTRKRQASIPVEKPQDQFWGMHNGIPGSEIDNRHSLKNVNVIDFRKYFRVRQGTDEFGSVSHGYSATIDTATDRVTTSLDLQTGDRIWFSADAHPYLGVQEYDGVNSRWKYQYLHAYRGWHVKRISAGVYEIYDTYDDIFNGTKLNIQTTGTNVYAHYGPLNSWIIHERYDLIVWHFGWDVYVSDLDMSSFTRAINRNQYYFPQQESMMTVVGNDVYCATLSGIFKIRLDVDRTLYTMIKCNGPCPEQPVLDLVENEAESRIWGYHVIYSWGDIGKDYARKRTNAFAEILHESGTSIVPGGQAKDYGEVFYDTPIDNDTSDPHVYGFLRVPRTVTEATVLPTYRTLNIGEASGGASERVDGIGNRTDVMVWVDDVPVAKAYRLQDMQNTNVGTVEDDDTRPLNGEIGCEIEIMDVSTESTVNRKITLVSENERTVTVDGAALDGDKIACIGHGLLFRASQSGTTITIDKPAAGVFVPNHRGQTIFRSDGKISVIKNYLTATTAEAAESETWTDLACTIKPENSNFYRRYNDTVPDDGKGRAIDSLLARLATKQDIYIPRRIFLPMPNCDMIISESGFVLTGIRGTEWYRYCQYGDKDYAVGYYRPIDQEDKTPGDITHIKRIPYTGILFLKNKTYAVPLNVSSDVGRLESGEVVKRLNIANVIDDDIGVEAWQTIRDVRAGVIFAFTSEPAARFFTSAGWSKENIGYDNRTGDDAVMKFYLKKLSLTNTFATAVATQDGGIKIWFRRP